jgi:hypothetical protein
MLGVGLAMSQTPVQPSDKNAPDTVEGAAKVLDSAREFSVVSRDEARSTEWIRSRVLLAARSAA